MSQGPEMSPTEIFQSRILETIAEYKRDYAKEVKQISKEEKLKRNLITAMIEYKNELKMQYG